MAPEKVNALGSLKWWIQHTSLPDQEAQAQRAAAESAAAERAADEKAAVEKAAENSSAKTFSADEDTEDRTLRAVDEVLKNESEGDDEVLKTASEEDARSTGTPNNSNWVEDGHTTSVIIRNIACRYTDEDVAGILERAGMAGKFDAVYVPKNPKRKSNLGYVFVCFRTNAAAVECYNVWNGKTFGHRFSKRPCQVDSANVQGLDNFVAHAHRAIQRGSKNPQPKPLFLF
mmetsp:Transcript_16961/g.49663  ORF Transcript_16961/g.49663 Transcript_16961/m.49663 type:complete len:230 (+) Transcript_16961:2-691(+)